MPATPGQLYRRYMETVKALGYDSPEANEAFKSWKAMAERFGRDVYERELETERLFGDKRPLSEIYPAA